MIPLRLYLYAAAALAIVGLLWHDHYVAGRLKSARTENTTLKATILAERENLRKANESAIRYAGRLAVARGPRSPPARLLCQLPRSVPAASTAAPGADAAPAADDGRMPESVDIGPRLDVSFQACEENLIGYEELQRWVRGR